MTFAGRLKLWQCCTFGTIWQGWKMCEFTYTKSPWCWKQKFLRVVICVTVTSLHNSCVLCVKVHLSHKRTNRLTADTTNRILCILSLKCTSGGNILMILLIINWANFMYILLLDPTPVKFLSFRWSIAASHDQKCHRTNIHGGGASHFGWHQRAISTPQMHGFLISLVNRCKVAP